MSPWYKGKHGFVWPELAIFKSDAWVIYFNVDDSDCLYYFLKGKWIKCKSQEGTEGKLLPACGGGNNNLSLFHNIRNSCSLMWVKCFFNVNVEWYNYPPWYFVIICMLSLDISLSWDYPIAMYGKLMCPEMIHHFSMIHIASVASNIVHNFKMQHIKTTTREHKQQFKNQVSTMWQQTTLLTLQHIIRYIIMAVWSDSNLQREDISQCHSSYREYL